MEQSIEKYKQLLNLPNATFLLIDHEDAMVATVYQITLSNKEPLILKVCERANDYLREILFLKCFANNLPVPKIVQTIEPSEEIHGAILMEYLPGTLLRSETLTNTLAYEIDALHSYILTTYPAMEIS